jgi:hypothetical protein
VFVTLAVGEFRKFTQPQFAPVKYQLTRSVPNRSASEPLSFSACESFVTDPRYYTTVKIEVKFLYHPDDVEMYKNAVLELGEKVISLEQYGAQG